MIIPIMTEDGRAMEYMRIARDGMLKETDWTQLPDAPVDRQAWATYRQALRNAPETYDGGPEWDAPDPPA